MTPDQMLIDIHAKVASIDARTEDFCARLERVEEDCGEIKTTIAREQGLDVARDRDLAELRDMAGKTGRSSGLIWGTGAGSVVIVLAELAKAAWQSITGTGTPPAP